LPIFTCATSPSQEATGAASGEPPMLMVGPPGFGKSNAGATPALDPSAAGAEGAARSLDDRFRRRRARRRQADGPAAVPRAASFGLDGGDGWRRLARAAGRSVACASRPVVPRNA